MLMALKDQVGQIVGLKLKLFLRRDDLGVTVGDEQTALIAHASL